MRLLVVEDDAALCASLEQALVHAGYAVDTTGNGEDAGHLGDTEPLRPKFVETFLNNLVNWKFAEANFA